ncbi:MAG: FAD-dependent thymidylate synthase [Alphaproteobacteria bacterium]|jgi:thymidylate synthase (FAD)
MAIQIQLVSRPVFDADAYITAIAAQRGTWRRTQEATGPEEIVEAAGRICYLSFGAAQAPRTNSEYIDNLVHMGHESVLEHVSWGFVLTGVSRGFSHQLVRHRIGWAFSQLSQQYHNERDAEFVAPSALTESLSASAAWSKAIAAAREAYREILDSLRTSGVSNDKEFRRAIFSAARSVLPNATETKIFATANARALRHFFTVRGAIEGDEEMRQVSTILFQLVHPEAPALFSDFVVERLEDGSPRLVQRSSGRAR